jgi:glycosyltransferase involved in cell wall biosynthesis
MKSWPRISIVTPSFNQARYIHHTVRSVLLQDYPDLEYMIFDGGSTDGTAKILAPYLNRLTHYQSAPDHGQSDAIASGFDRSTGQIMAWLNSDDMLAPGALHFVAQYFSEHPEVDALYSHRCIVGENNNVRSYWILPEHHDYLMRRWDMIPQETCFWRRSLFEKCGNLNRSYHFALDYDLLLRFMSQGRFARVNRFLGAFRKHKEAKTLRLLRTEGREEIQKVRREHGINISPPEKLVGALFFRWVVGRGWLHAIRRHTLPGAFPGVNYDYDDVWTGRRGAAEPGEEAL